MAISKLANRRNLLNRPTGTGDNALDEKRKDLQFLAAQGNTQHGIRARQELAELDAAAVVAASPVAVPVIPAPVAEQPLPLAIIATPQVAREVTAVMVAPGLDLETTPVPLAPTPVTRSTNPKKTPPPTEASALPTPRRRARQQALTGAEPNKESTYYAPYRQERFSILLHRRYNLMLREMSLAYELSPGGQKLPLTELVELALDKLAESLNVKKRE